VALAGPLIQQRLDLMELALAHPPVAAPGTRMVYTNFGYVIAGAFAERVTGQSWEVLMRQMLFDPLGMATAGFGTAGPGEPWGHTGEGCQPVTAGFETEIPAVIGPAATVRCSMGDWGRYATLHLRGARGESGLLLRPETFRQLHADWYRQGYALGWVVIESERAGGVELTHAGATGLSYAEILIAPEHSGAFVVAGNCGSEGGLRACSSVIAAMIRQYL
jgi:CubicO group peptidase (beta-lactamase class C family)